VLKFSPIIEKNSLAYEYVACYKEILCLVSSELSPSSFFPKSEGLSIMKYLPIAFALFLAVFFVSSCGTSKQEGSRTEEVKAAKERMIMNTPPPPIAPGTCKVVAIVELIDKTLIGMSANDPCSKAPCSATVKIDSILGYGSAFPKPLVVGQSLRVRFAHTLSPTKEMFPDIKPALPGLRATEKFEALISGSETVGNSEPSYTIYAYEKK
jgi:hypothetical protein